MILLIVLLLQIGANSSVLGATCHGAEVMDPSGRFCYIVNPTSLAFGDAERACNQYGGYKLAKVSSMIDNNFLFKFAKKDGYLFIGATDVTPDGSWEWVDGSRMEFSNWATDGPKTGSCAMMRYTDGKWERTSCETLLPSICYGLARGAPTDAPTTPRTTTRTTWKEGQFLMFIGDSESMGDPNGTANAADFYSKQRDLIMAAGDHVFNNNIGGDNFVCDVWADVSFYGWASYQQGMSLGTPLKQTTFDRDLKMYDWQNYTYQMNNITTAIEGLRRFRWYPRADEMGYNVLVFFTARQDFSDVPSLFEPFPNFDEIVVVLMNGSPMKVPSNDRRVSKVTISNAFNQNDVQSLANALKCQ